MTTNYRIIHFVADPFSGFRVPIAALVSDGDAVRVLPSSHIPGPACLGGRPQAALVRMILENLRNIGDFNILPPSIGPQAVLGPTYPAPAKRLDEAIAWVAAHILPQAPQTGRPATCPAKPSPRQHLMHSSVQK